MMNRYVSIAMSILLFLGFFGLQHVEGGLWVSFWGPWTRSSDGELRLWLATTLFLFPACCLLSYGLSPFIARLLQNLIPIVRHSSTKQRCWGLLLIFVMAFAAARMGNIYVLQGYPITDDEWGTKFGGDVLATGKLMVEPIEPSEAFNHRFLYKRDGLMTSLDWPGVLGAWAFANITQSDTLLWALTAALTVLALVLLIYFEFSPAWALVAAMALLCSPMNATLNMTTHAHVLSKLPLAAALLFYVLASKHQKFWMWVAAGFFGASACAFRPYECFTILLPFLVYSIWQSFRKNSRFHGSFAGILAGACLPVLLQAWYYQQVTGHFWLPPRLAFDQADEAVSNITNLSRFWSRFGANVSQNVLMLEVWFLGCVGLITFVWGVSYNWLTRLCGWSVVCVLAVALLHDDHGIHSVGPIHYSECVIPLIIVCIAGMRQIWLMLTKRPDFQSIYIAAVSLFLILGLGGFSYFHWQGLKRQSELHRTIFDYVTSETIRIKSELDKDPDTRVIIAAPRYRDVWLGIPAFLKVATFVYDWPMPKPGLTEPISFANAYEGVGKALQTLYPEHLILELSMQPKPPFIFMKPFQVGDYDEE